MTRERLLALLDCFAKLHIVVMGDLFLDRWLTIDPTLTEPSVETGLDAWQVVSSRQQGGAAGTVLNTLSAVGIGKLQAISMVGTDGEGFMVKRALAEKGVDTSTVITSTQIMTPAYVKPMVLQPDGSLLEGNRLDYKNRQPTPKALENKLIALLEAAAETADAIVLLDQLTEEGHGVITPAVRKAAARIATSHPDLIIFADSRAFIDRFRHIIIKCNNYEAAALSGIALSDSFQQTEAFAALDFLSRQSNRLVFVTCNEHGIAVKKDGQPMLLPAAKQQQPIDICGAGDACSAGIVSALCAGADPAEAAVIGNLCAGVTVRKLGTTGTANQQEVLALYAEQFEGGVQ